MTKSIILAGKINMGISKPTNINQIIKKINKLKIKKIDKEILLLASIIITSSKKRTIDLVSTLRRFKRDGRVYPDYSSSNYITNILEDVMELDKEEFSYKIEKLIRYVQKYEVSL